MKKQFEHLLPLSEAEVGAIWNSGILTVDTSVLLDLYRLHPESRARLLEAIRSFDDRVWLTHQAGREFLANRHEVIQSVEDELRRAEKSVGEHSSEMLNALKACRPLPREFESAVKERLDELKKQVETQLREVRMQRASEGAEDVVLAAVLGIFEGRTAEEPSAKDLEDAHKEAVRRLEKRIPPGYKDAKKEDQKAHGDYLIWREVLERAKAMEKPFVLVTSERKEDWWEIRAGKTIGPREELLEEAHRVAGQRVLIHQTESFVKRAAGRTGQSLSEAVVADLQAWRNAQAHGTAGHELATIVEELLTEAAPGFVDSDTLINGRIAETNASDWDVASVEVSSVGPLDYGECTAPFEATLHLSGEQDEDRMWCGTSITAQLAGVVSFDGKAWALQECDATSAEIDYPGADSDDDEPDIDPQDTNPDGVGTLGAGPAVTWPPAPYQIRRR
ncbi:MAG: PIN domain-containing protein [Myxococcota bacterium]